MLKIIVLIHWDFNWSVQGLKEMEQSYRMKLNQVEIFGVQLLGYTMMKHILMSKELLQEPYLNFHLSRWAGVAGVENEVNSFWINPLGIFVTAKIACVN